MARKIRKTMLAAVLSLGAVVAFIPGAAATGQDRERACLDAHHMALVSNAIHRGVAVDARLVEGCRR
jgi:hypothetical protein